MNQEQTNEKKHNYFYKITNLINGKFYYGIRSTNKDPEKDDYWGSGKLIKGAIKKYGKANFKKEIIFNYLTREEVNEHEKFVVTTELIESSECYNLKTGGHSGYPSVEVRKRMSEWQIGKTVTEETIQKIKETKELRKDNYAHLTQQRLERNGGVWQTEETKEKISETLKSKNLKGENSPNFGKKKDPSVGEKISKANKGRPGTFTGRTHSTESKRKMSESRSGENHYAFGTHLTQEAKDKISKVHKGKIVSDETRQRMCNSAKKSPCIIDGIYYESLKSAYISLNQNKDYVRFRLNSKLEKWKEWNYATDNL